VHAFKRKWGGTDVFYRYGYYGQGYAKAVAGLQNLRQGRTLKQKLWRLLPLRVSRTIGPWLRQQDPFG
jgi:hypothetical protein